MANSSDLDQEWAGARLVHPERWLGSTSSTSPLPMDGTWSPGVSVLVAIGEIDPELKMRRKTTTKICRLACWNMLELYCAERSVLVCAFVGTLVPSPFSGDTLVGVLGVLPALWFLSPPPCHFWRVGACHLGLRHDQQHHGCYACVAREGAAVQTGGISKWGWSNDAWRWSQGRWCHCCSLIATPLTSETLFTNLWWDQRFEVFTNLLFKAIKIRAVMILNVHTFRYTLSIVFFFWRVDVPVHTLARIWTPGTKEEAG